MLLLLGSRGKRFPIFSIFGPLLERGNERKNDADKYFAEIYVRAAGWVAGDANARAPGSDGASAPFFVLLQLVNADRIFLCSVASATVALTLIALRCPYSGGWSLANEGMNPLPQSLRTNRTRNLW